LLSLWQECRRQKTWSEDKDDYDDDDDDDDDDENDGDGSGSYGGNGRWSFPRTAQKINSTHYSELYSSFLGLQTNESFFQGSDTHYAACLLLFCGLRNELRNSVQHNLVPLVGSSIFGLQYVCLPVPTTTRFCFGGVGGWRDGDGPSGKMITRESCCKSVKRFIMSLLFINILLPSRVQ
jgi:hypothetical protein